METQPPSSSLPPSRGWCILRRCVIGIAVLATLDALIYAEQDLHGHFAWAAVKRDCAARGLDLNPRDLEPAPVPDDQNFAMTPFLAPLLDLNPQPLKPGQSTWRDTNAYQKTVDFAKDFFGAFNALNGNATSPEDPRINLVGLAKALHKQAKTPIPDYPSRAAAAAEILGTFQSYAPVLDEIRAAAARPYSRFNIHYDDPDPTMILLPHLAQVKKLACIFACRASAELATGNHAAAYEDVQTALSLADSLRGEPFMISHLVRVAILTIDERVIWEGLAEHAWSDQQLEKLQDRLSKFNLLDGQSLSMRYELAAHGTELFDLLERRPTIAASDLEMNGATLPLRLIPIGSIQLERVSYVRIESDFILTSFDPKSGVVHPRTVELSATRVDALLGNKVSLVLHHRIIARILTPNLVKFYQKSGYGQTSANEAMIACALERYRMASGQFPGTLDALMPKYLAEIPRDVIDGGALKYEPTGTNQFKLYSVGWNETDDNGQNCQMDPMSHSLDLATGDWIWAPYREN